MSPQPCTICEHPEREEIDEALQSGEPGRAIARRFGLAEASLRRHRGSHFEALAPASDLEAEAFAPSEESVKEEEEEAPDAVPENFIKPHFAAPAPEDPRSVAERRVAAEEEEHRQARIAEYEREETERREEARRQAELEARQAIWRGEAEEIAGERAAVEIRAEEKVEELLEIFAELNEVDQRHRAALRNAGTPVLMEGPVDMLVAGWLAGRLGDRYAKGTDYRGVAGSPSLVERDRLARPAVSS